MAKLILSLDGAVLQEYSLDKPRITIGRKAHNDIPIDNLAVSGEHASISTVGNDSILEDLGSTNGTLVNGQTAQKHMLQDGDLIEIGKYKLKYMAERVMVKEKTEEEENDFDKTMIIRPMAAKPQPKPDAQGPSTMPYVEPAAKPAQPAGAGMAPAAAPATGAAAAGVAKERVAVVQLLNGPNTGKELELTKSLTSLGKPGVQVAVIAKRPHGYFITHVQGDRFPVVNGKQLDAQAHQLNDHDVIELAGAKMEFYFK
jgi:pSer/pThr/pTyr-binding forkhead associated (FHA) protein